MATGIEEIQNRLEDLQKGAQAVMDKAKSEDRELTDDEQGFVDEQLSEFDRQEAALERMRKVAALENRLSRPAGRQTKPDDVQPATAARTPTEREPSINVVSNRGTWDWQSFGHFARAVRQASGPGGYIDPRITAHMAPGSTTTSREFVGADGGFAVPPDFRAEISNLIMAERSLAGLCDVLTSSSNTFGKPKDDTTPWQTSGGILCYWEGEGTALTQSKVLLKREIVPLDKLTCLVPVTDELLEDAPALDAYLRRKAPEKMSFAIDLAIVQGNGVGQPTGILNSGALVSVAKESEQAADTVKFENVAKMWARCYGPSRINAVWLINQDVEYQLMAMEFTGTNSSTPAYLPANGLAGSPYGTLLGRPVIPTQACETLGDLGDIFLVDLKQYMLVQKVGGLRADVSIHLWFDYDTAAYRFIQRVGGRTWWDAAIDPRDGSNTLSPYVTLAERAAG